MLKELLVERLVLDELDVDRLVLDELLPDEDVLVDTLAELLAIELFFVSTS